ncbi:MAG: metal ABC transporter substrate-binding protein [Trueperaceae bacterium]
MPAIRLTVATLLLLVGGLSHARLTVVASLAPYGNLVEQIVDGRADVLVMLPPGASPHTFEPTPRMAATLAGADLVVLNGSLDEWLHDLVAAANARVPVVEALELLDEELEAIGLDDDHEPGEDSSESAVLGDAKSGAHAHAGHNPHIWLDPVLLGTVVLSLGDKLAELDPTNDSFYRMRAGALRDELTELDRELRQTLAPLAGAPFIPFHDAWPHFARRYDLDLLLEIEPFPGREPSPRYLATAIGIIRESGAPAIFTETGLNDRPARVLADEAGVELYSLDPLGATGERYQDLMRRNAGVIADALMSWRK